MKISIFGLGYVGTVSAACLAEMGHQVTGVDIDAARVELLQSGKPPVIETGLADLTQHMVNAGRLAATTDSRQAILETDISIICVGTPGQDNGDSDCRYLEKACYDIGLALAEKNSFHVVAVRSTLLPGTMQRLVIPTLEHASGRKAGKDFGVCHHPEFMREGSAIADFHQPPKIVIGAGDTNSGDMVASLYASLPAPMIRCAMETAEMVKYADNAWHATKIVFANEMGRLCRASGIDSHTVMDIFCQDTKLNISPHYLTPAFAFGGSCLPKDVRALLHTAHSLDLETPLLASLMPSNQAQIAHAIQMITATGKVKIGFLGFSFKAGTDDLRESPVIVLIEHLHKAGLQLQLYDRNVNEARKQGLKIPPLLAALMVDGTDTVIHNAEVIVIGNNAPEFSLIASQLRPEQIVIDLVRIPEIERVHANYQGICW